MHTTGKRLLAVLLAALMLFTAAPMGALAAITQNTPEYNKEILNALQSITGSEDEAQAYYDVMQQYGLLDEDGNAVESWSIVMDGEEITADDLREILAGDYDPDKHIYVDGTFVTLADVKTMLDIEDYVAHIRETYYSDTEWTQEQIESYQSLAAQVQKKGITLTSTRGGTSVVGASGVNHGARVSVAQGTTSGNTVTFNVSLSGAAEGQTVTFDWKALSGSRPVSGTTSGTVTLTADGNGTASKTFNVTLASITTTGTSPVRSSSTVFYVDCSNIKNALFSNNQDTLAVNSTMAGTVSAADMPTASTPNVISGSTGHDSIYKPYTELDNSVSGDQIALSAAQRNAIAWGIWKTATLTKENYDTTVIRPDTWHDYGDNAPYQQPYIYPAYDCTATVGNTVLFYRTGYPNEGEQIDASDARELQTSENLTMTLSATDVPQSVSFSGGKKLFQVANTVRQDICGEDQYYRYLNYNGYIEFRFRRGGSYYVIRDGVVYDYTTRYPYETSSLTGEVSFSDTSNPTIVSISAFDGTYTAGEVVPIIVRYSEPVAPASATLTVNNVVLTPMEANYSNVLTFPYTVKEVDNKTSVSVTAAAAKDISGRSLDVSYSSSDPGRVTFTNGAINLSVTMETPVKSHALTGISAAPDKQWDEAQGKNVDVIKVEVPVSSDPNMTTWMGSDFNDVDGKTSRTVKVSVDNLGAHTAPLAAPDDSGFTGQTMVAYIPLDLNQTDSGKDYVVELFVDDRLVVGKTAAATQPPAVFISQSDVTNIKLSVNKTDENGDPVYDANGNPVNYFGENSDGNVYVQDQPIIKASFALAKKEYTFPELVWSSSDPTVAEIYEDGTVALKGVEGTCKFTLTAPNGGVAGKEVQWKTDTITVAEGLTPFLYFPKTVLQSVSGKDVKIYWTSNICKKNGETPTTFHVSVTRGGVEVYSEDVTGTASSPASGVTLPSSIMEFHYGPTAVNTLNVTVSTSFNGINYKHSAAVTLESVPAKIKLNKLDSYYILDTAGSVEIGWDITNFNRFSSENAADLFRLLITKGSETVYDSNDPGAGGEDGHYTGSYNLGNLAFSASSSDKSSYRQVYTVTIQAKNGEDSTWSYDSYLLYVYDAGTLKLWVDGADTDSLTMSNESAIAAMSQEEILALKRDISLHNVISANYGEYAWMELADQLAWASSNNDVATVNYQQGTLYEDIRDFSYVSYRPTTEFVISGLSDGQTTVSATHVRTGMKDSVNVTVETLKDKLYLFQCYPQVKTALTYKDSAGTEKTVYSDNTGAAAIYEANGIQSDVYCRSTGKDGHVYLGTFYLSDLISGERDSTKLELYPCNNLQLRRAAYAYLYLKKPDGTPYTGKIDFRGGVYVDGNYISNARFALNSTGAANVSGVSDKEVSLGADGKLEIVMDQTQWGLPGNQISAENKVHYTFLIKQGDNATAYYPIFADIDATVNLYSYVESGDAIVNFRDNTDKDKKVQPFIIAQYATVKNPEQNYSMTENILDSTGRVGPTDSLPETDLKTVVMWWGDSAEAAANGKVRLFTETELEIAPNASSQYNSRHDFASELFTTYTVTLNEESLQNVVDPRVVRGTYLEYYRDGANLCRKETLSLRVCNLLGMGKVEESDTLTGQLQQMGMAMGTSAKSEQSFGDKFVAAAMNLVASDSFSEGRGSLFQMKIAPTADPTKFLGFVEVNVGNMEGNVTGVYADTAAGSDTNFGYKPGFKELSSLFAMRKGVTNGLQQYAMKYMEEYNKVLLRRKLSDIHYEVQGYMETMIYYDFASGEWKMTVLDGGFDLGGGLSYSWIWNYMVGPVPFTVELKVGGTAEVNMDAITTAYKPTADAADAEFGTEYLTELRIYLYLKLFAGVGIDYSVVALKIGIFGQIDMDMRFRWLNRPYLEEHPDAYLLATGEQRAHPYTDAWWIMEDVNMFGDHFRLSGTLGLEIVVKFLFVSYEKALFSYTFDLANSAGMDWDRIDYLWDANQKNLMKAIATMLDNGSASTTNAGGRQMISLNLAPTVESRDYLADGESEWNTPVVKKGLAGLFKAPARAVTGVSSLQTNAYPYANPELSADGELLVYLSDQNSANVTDTRAAFAVKSGSGYAQGGVIDNNGLGDSQLVVDGNKDFAVSAWTRQTVDIQKDAGSVLTNEDQMMMLNGTEVYASVHTGGRWTTTRLTENGGADVAPAVAVNGSRAIVAWRSVVPGDAENITNFDQKDTILYKIYENGAWSEPMSLYNGTSGEVKGITAVMMENGASAVAYTLDTDSSDATITDREIVYAVVGADGEVVRNVRATTDEKLDENPQLAVVSFPTDDADTERFVLGWFTQTESDGDTVADISLFDFDDTGVTGQKMPQSLSEATADCDVNISSNFRFAKNAEDINELSIVWVERDEGTINDLPEGTGSGSSSDTADVGDVASEKDVLRGVKFYTYGENSELIGFTGALNVAEMPDATLIDHFDAYSSGGTSISAAVLGTTYGKNGATETKTGETVNGETVSYTVPKATSAVYTATDTYEDKIEVGGLMADYETIKLGTKTQIRLCVRNSGINAVNKLTVKIGDTTTVFSDLNLLPGSTLPVWADYEVPEDKVEDAAYTVTAKFAKTGNVTSTGTVYLDFADLQITDAAIMEEVDGLRVIQLKLNNGSDAALANSGRSVRISFYSDPTFETPIDETFLPAVTVTNNADLKMIDEGGYSVQTAFDVAAYVKGDSAETVEIPESGVPVYILAEVILDGEVDPEFDSANNTASVTCDNLKARTGQDVTLTSDFAIEGEGDSATTTVTVNMQNTRLGETASGNLIVTLLDGNGEVLEQKQSYSKTAPNNGLLILGGEAKATETFTFSAAGADAQVLYSDVVLDYDNVELVNAAFSNIPGVTAESFTEQADGTFTATATADDVATATVTAVAGSVYSTVSVKAGDGETVEGSNTVSQVVPLALARNNTITITVTSYNGDSRDYVLTVMNRKSINVYADTKEKTYGDPDPTFTWHSPDLEGDDTLDVNMWRDDGKDVGTYVIHGEVTTENYIPTFVEANLTINKRPIYIAAEPKEKIYGDPDPELTWTQEGLVEGDALNVTLTREEGRDVGVYAIDGDIAISDNYTPIFVLSTLTINKRKLVITADPQTKVYGESDPELTCQAQNIAYDDEIPVTLVREPGENVGTYKITTDVDACKNYIISFTGANLTITKKTLSVTADAKAKTYGQADPELTYTVTGLVGDDTLTGELTREPGETKGTYAIQQGTVAASDDYVIDYTGADLTIAEKTINVTAHAKSKTYGAADPELTYTVEGLEDGDALTGSLTRDEGEAAGTYAITLGTLSAGDDYAINYTGAKLTIGTKALTVKADAVTKVYGDADPNLTYTVEGLSDGDEISVTLTRAEGENVGSYAVSAQIDGVDNYAVTYIPADFTITKRPLTITADAKSKREEKSDPKLTYSVKGLVEGDEISVKLTREPGEEVGRYAITAEIDAGENYEVTYVGASFKITSKYCPLCGEVHDGNIFQSIVGCIHRFIYILKNMFNPLGKIG